MKEFEEYLRRIGKSENTALTYCRNIRMYFSWCRDSFGSEPKELYRSNVLEYISYMVRCFRISQTIKIRLTMRAMQQG